MAKNTSSSEFLFDPMNDAAFKSLVRAEETREFMDKERNNSVNEETERIKKC